MADSLEVALLDFSGETAADPSPAAITSAEALLDIIHRTGLKLKRLLKSKTKSIPVTKDKTDITLKQKTFIITKRAAGVPIKEIQVETRVKKEIMDKKFGSKRKTETEEKEAPKKKKKNIL